MKYLPLLLVLITSLAASEKPNIVYILADDMGVGDVACLNPQAKVKTPNLDSMAAKGMVFSDAHTSSAVCTPTRYGLMTGRYNWRSELKAGVLNGYSKALISPGRDTVASLLKRHGYKTAMIGKSHLGFNWLLKDGSRVSEFKGPKDIETKIDFTQPFTGGPCDWGFNSFYGIAASLDFPPYVMLADNKATAVPTIKRPFHGGKKVGQPQTMMRGGLQVETFKPELVLKHLSEKAVDFISQQNDSQAFFLYMPLNSPHTPVMPRKEFLGSSQAGIYGDFIQETDWVVGQVIKALKDKNLLENTLVIFTADNGASKASFSEAQEKEFDHKPSYIYNGRKGSLLEGGHRVPFIAQWPASVQAGTIANKACNLNDLYATCVEIIGAKKRANAGEDSTSILSILTGHPDNYPQTRFVHHDFGGRFAYRSGDWKLILSPNKKKNFLFNLKDDVSETSNLYEQKPEIIERLTKELTEIVLSGRSTPGLKQANDGAQRWEQLFWIK